MSAGPDPRAANAQVIEQERRRLSQRLDEVARLCESGVAPTAFYGELLQRLLESLAAVAGCVWIRTAQGNLQQQFQINMQQVGLDASEEARQGHDALLRVAFTSAKPMHLPARSAHGAREEGKVTPGNLTNFMLLLVPIMHNEQVVGLIEVFQGANRPSAAVPGFLQYMTLMADLAGRYQRNQLVGQLVGQQQVWTQLEAFARTIHGSLNTTEVAFHVANEGRRLVECDRLSVAVRRGGQRTTIEAVSGSDVVEKRSNQVRLMRALCDAVLQWGEKLVFTGAREDSLPPKVLDGLDAYLAENPSKLLVILPLSDEREGDGKDKPKLPMRSALLMECYESPPDPPQTIARLEVVGRHATSAVYNAIEHRRIPMRWVWLPLARLQEGFGGKTRSIIALCVMAASVVITGLIVLPYPLKLDSPGIVQPVVRRGVFSPVAGTVVDFEVEPNSEVKEGASLAIMYDGNLATKVRSIQAEMRAAHVEAEENMGQAMKNNLLPAEKAEKEAKAALKRIEERAKAAELEDVLQRTNSNRNKFGEFFLLAPKMAPQERAMVELPLWTVLTSDFKFNLKGSEVKPTQQIMQLGVKNGPWEVELKIPQKHIGQVLRSFDLLNTDTLDVDFVLMSDTTTKYRGRLERGKIAGEAKVSKDESNDAEPFVLAYARVEGDDIDPDYLIDRRHLVSGTEVKAKLRCGNRPAGYSLFYGVWEFLYERVVFYFF
jgi:hypothetical protein